MLDPGEYFIFEDPHRPVKIELSYCNKVKIIGLKKVKIINNTLPPKSIYFTYCYNLKIINVTFQSAVFYRCKKLQIKRCKFLGRVPVNLKPVTFQECNNVQISKCGFHNFMDRPCMFIGTNKVTFIKNKIESNGDNALFSFCRNVKLLKNTFISDKNIKFYGCRKITLRNNFPSFIPKQILNKKYKGVGIVIGRVVNVRAKPTLRSSVVFRVKENQRVSILSKTRFIQKIAGTKAKWYKIKTDAGKTGYVFGAFVFEVNSLFTSSWRIVSDHDRPEFIYFRPDGVFVHSAHFMGGVSNSNFW